MPHQLEVVLLEAKNLKAVDWINKKSDPFVEIKTSMTKVKSKKISKNLNPVWNQAFKVKIEDPEKETLVFTVYDHGIIGRGGRGEKIGRASVTLNNLRIQKPEERWVTLEKVKTGEIRIRLTALDFGAEEITTPMFGVPLEELVTRENRGKPIPLLFEKAIAYLSEPKVLQEEGILRLAGPSDEVVTLKRRFERGEDVNLSEVLDPHAVGDLLKRYLRELPQPLISADLSNQIVTAIKANQGQGDVIAAKIRDILLEMPTYHYELFYALITFLVRIAQNTAKNKMDSSNLAICLAPSLKCAPGAVSYPIEFYDVCFASSSSNLNSLNDNLRMRTQTMPSKTTTSSSSSSSLRPAVPPKRIDARMPPPNSSPKSTAAAIISPRFVPNIDDKDTTPMSPQSVPPATRPPRPPTSPPKKDLLTSSEPDEPEKPNDETNWTGVSSFATFPGPGRSGILPNVTSPSVSRPTPPPRPVPPKRPGL